MLINIVPESNNIKPEIITTHELSIIIEALKLYLSFHNNEGQIVPDSFMMPYPTFYTPQHKQHRERYIGQLIRDFTKIAKPI